MLQPFLVKSIREDIRNVVLADAARQSLSSAASMYSRPSAVQVSRPNTGQAKPPQQRSQQRTQPARVPARRQTSVNPQSS